MSSGYDQKGDIMRNTASVARKKSHHSQALHRHISGARWCRLSVATALALGSAVLLSEAGHANPPVTVMNSWFRYIMPQVPAGGYMTLKNSSRQPVVLTGASSAACEALMLHRSEQRGGVERMMNVPQLTVPAQGTVHIAPGGYHLMCMQPKMRPGEVVHVMLSFREGGTISAAFPVYAVGHEPNAR